jgi:putative transposase
MSHYKFIEAAKKEHEVSILCRVLKVSRAAYYRWTQGFKSSRAERDNELLAKMDVIRKGFGKSYGPVRMRQRLGKDGVRCGLRRVRRLMGIKGWLGKRSRGYKRSTTVAAGVPDLVQRDFSSVAPGEKFVGDITQISVAGIWLYLAVVMDCYSRRIVGWSMSTSANTDLVLGALSMATERCQVCVGAIFHSDRGCQYTSNLFRDAVTAYGMRQSLGSPGQCWDNAAMESFFASLKKELVVLPEARSLAALRSNVFEYIETFYNPVRLHSYLGYQSPLEFEANYHGAKRSA